MHGKFMSGKKFIKFKLWIYTLFVHVGSLKSSSFDSLSADKKKTDKRNDVARRLSTQNSPFQKFQNSFTGFKSNIIPGKILKLASVISFVLLTFHDDFDVIYWRIVATTMRIFGHWLAIQWCDGKFQSHNCVVIKCYVLMLSRKQTLWYAAGFIYIALHRWKTSRWTITCSSSSATCKQTKSSVSSAMLTLKIYLFRS